MVVFGHKWRSEKEEKREGEGGIQRKLGILWYKFGEQAENIVVALIFVETCN